MMSSHELMQQLLTLPIAERLAIAEALWESIALSPNAADGEWETIEQAKRRESELSFGTMAGRTHEQVMRAATKSTSHPRN